MTHSCPNLAGGRSSACVSGHGAGAGRFTHSPTIAQANRSASGRTDSTVSLASTGSVFHLPLAVEPDPAAAVRAAQDAGLQVLAADGAGELSLDDAGDLLARPTAWLFGNEAWGLPDELAALADHRVRIPIHGRAESLNLSTAAALCLYASARAQRA